ncbi:hypothetical protein [Micromonospora chersina]
MPTQLAIRNVIKQPLRSVTIAINGTTQTFAPQFSRVSNTGDAHHTCPARFDPTVRPATGRAGGDQPDRQQGQSGQHHGAVRVTADESGRIYASGVSAYQVAGRSRLTHGGRRLAPYAGGDAWVLVLSADLRPPVSWVVLTDLGYLAAWPGLR